MWSQEPKHILKLSMPPTDTQWPLLGPMLLETLEDMVTILGMGRRRVNTEDMSSSLSWLGVVWTHPLGLT